MDHPPFIAAPKLTAIDALSRNGAQALAERITAAWAACGHTITPEIEQLPAGLGWAVRIPQLIGGLPASVYHARRGA